MKEPQKKIISLEENLFSKESSVQQKPKQKPLTKNTENKQKNSLENLLFSADEYPKQTVQYSKNIEAEKTNKPLEIKKVKLEKEIPIKEKEISEKNEMFDSNNSPSKKNNQSVLEKTIAKSKSIVNDGIEKGIINKEVVENIKTNISSPAETTEKIIGKTYKAVKSTVLQQNKNENDVNIKVRKRKRKKIYKQSPSQHKVPIRSIYNGLIYTTYGKYVKILEMLPINYDSLSELSQDRIARTFGQLFHENTNYLHIKCITDKSNPNRLIQNIKKSCEEEKYQRGIDNGVIECAEDAIQKIKDISEHNAISKRFFISYEYEGKSNDKNEILMEMNTIKYNIASIAASMGNAIIDVPYENSSLEMGEILYYFYNRTTCRKESLVERITRITSDYEMYNDSLNKSKAPVDADFVAPKGLYITSPNYIYQDGQYKTFFALKNEGHPSAAYPGWLDDFTGIGEGTEIDIHIKKLSHDLTVNSLEQFTLFKTVSAEDKVNNRRKQKDMYSQIKNNNYIIDKMNSGEDLFDVCIIITISSDTIAGLNSLKMLLEKQLKTRKFYCEDASYQCENFYDSTVPLTYVNPQIFARNKHNYLTSSLESLYLMTSFEMYDPTGFLLGVNSDNTSPVVPNFFNTQIFPNANLSIFGGSGSGKTFSAQVLARSMRISGIRIFFILPTKGHEYQEGCDSINGQYIKMGPGMEDRINIMEIMPEQKLDRDALQEDIEFRDTSLLSKKIASLSTWIQLLLPNYTLSLDEISCINVALTNLYERFGITEDNNSIYEDDSHTTLKFMPIISDMYNEFKEYDELSTICKVLETFVNGPCRNMNGYTNVDLTNNYTVFDIDETSMSKQLLPSFLFIAFDCVYNLSKQNRLKNEAIFTDEVWKMMIHPTAAEQIGDMVRLIRGYGGSIIPITQDINAYLDSSAGKAILSNTDSKLILKLKESECHTMAKILNLSEKEQERIMSFKRGQGLLLAGRNRIFVDIMASQKEIYDFTTDPNILREKARLKSMQK